ncbi:MAG: hypothetical protein KAQ79_06125, partial [Cyclobacteriaceae bacterium]|nr:hypothetical protein [Cyclobacteriaceae bacterium]
MFKNISIRGKLTTLILFLVVVTICTSGYISYSIRKNMLQEKYLQNLRALADVKKGKIQAFINSAKTDIDLISNLEVFQSVNEEKEDTTIEEASDSIVMESSNFIEDETVDLAKAENTLNTIKNSIGAEKIIISDKNGEIIINTDPGEGSNIRQEIKATDDSITDGAQNGKVFSQVFKSGEDFLISIGAPIGDIKTSNALCFIILNINSIYEDLAQDMGLGETVEVIIAQKHQNIAIFLNPLKFDESAALNRAVTMESKEGIAIQQAVEGNEGMGYSVDYRNIETLSIWSFIPEMNWGIEVKVDQSEINQQALIVVKKFALWGGLILVFAIMIS